MERALGATSSTTLAPLLASPMLVLFLTLFCREWPSRRLYLELWLLMQERCNTAVSRWLFRPVFNTFCTFDCARASSILSCLPSGVPLRPPIVCAPPTHRPTPLRPGGQLRSEMSFVDKWLTGHVSDHSALNHRKNVVSALVAVSSGATEQKDVGNRSIGWQSVWKGEGQTIRPFC